MIEIGSIAHLIALLLAQQKPGGGKTRKLLVQRPRRGAGQPRQFTHVVTAVRIQEQLRECALAVGTEKEVK